jgi:hypothetical protein
MACGCTSGESSKPPEVRFQEHKSGARNRDDRGRLHNEDVRRWGVRLLPKFFAHLHPSCSAQAEARELARPLDAVEGLQGHLDALPSDERS